MSRRRDYACPEKEASGLESPAADRRSDLRNVAGTSHHGWHKPDTAGSQNVPEQENENPGALAGATGVKTSEQVSSEVEYRLRREWAIAAHFALDHCAPADAIQIASDTLSRLGAGSPLPVLLRATDEAVSWTQIATPVEIKAWALACFEAMPPRTQAAFLDFIAGRVRQ